MWSAGRRLPTRVAQQPQLSGLVAVRAARVGPQLGLQRYAAAPSHHQIQVRSFFGLKDLLFGDKKDTVAPTETTTKQTTDASNITEVTEPVVAGVPVAGETLAAAGVSDEPVAIVGSTDSIHYSIGKYARIADGAIMTTRGKTMVLTTAVSSAPPSGTRRKDFLPLMVDYRIKYYAAGLIPDTQRRSEMTNTDDEILQSRIIDRVIRPLFPRDYVDDTQVIATVQSLDPANDPLVLAVNSTSAALAVSDIPWNGPIGCVRVVEIDGQLVVNPTKAQRDIATLDIVYAANESRVLMIEANGNEVVEDRMAEALRFAHDAVLPLIDEQKELVKQYGKPKRVYERTIVPDDVTATATELGAPILEQLFSQPRYSKAERRQVETETYDALRTGLRAAFDGRVDADDSILQLAAHDVVQTALRNRILAGERNCRFDGRSTNSIRALQIETDILPMAHGSSVFSRGDTQALCSVTLGPLDRGLRLRTAHQDPTQNPEYKHAMLHYEFPPYCVNETGRIGGVNRRMVGHGALAEKALVPVIPSTDAFPYTVRMTSETMGSDGSSSMATVCGVTMALMDAGVPITSPVAGISIGLVTEGDPFDGTKEITNYRLVTDILGTEDHYGDMDFKIAGTETGITAVQLDVKLPGVPLEILCEGIQHARKARRYILKRMAAVLPAPRTELKASANGGSGGMNVGVKFFVPTSSIGALIGSGGSNVKEIEAATGCNVSIDRRTGEIHLVGPADSLETAKAIVLEQTSSTNAFYKTGDKYEMRVAEVMDFGAILESTAPTKNRGFVHITELADGRVESIHEIIKVGQVLEFVCIQEGVSGKMSLKALTNPPVAGDDTTVSSSTYHKRPTTGAPKRRSKSPHTGSKPVVRTGVGHRRTSKPTSTPEN